MLRRELEGMDSQNVRSSIERLIGYVKDRGESDNISLAVVLSGN